MEGLGDSYEKMRRMWLGQEIVVVGLHSQLCIKDISWRIL